MEYRIAREARDRYHLDEAHFTSRAQATDTGVARRVAWRIVQGGGARPERPINGGDLAAIALIHELQHRAIDQANAITATVTKGHLEALEGFEALFPSRPVYVGAEDPRHYLRAKTDGAPNRLLTAEELLLVWVANRNPAFMRYDELFDEAELARHTGYPEVVEAIRARTSREARRTGGQDLVERLLEPARHAPDSLAEQLRWIAAHWPDLVDDELSRLLARAIDVLAEEEEGARRAWERHVGGGGVQPAALFGFGGAQDEPESFSADRDWMPDLVLMAKSSYVWLDQLSRAYGRAIGPSTRSPTRSWTRSAPEGSPGCGSSACGSGAPRASASSRCAATPRRWRRRTRSTTTASPTTWVARAPGGTFATGRGRGASAWLPTWCLTTWASTPVG
ncbi:MAG: hypothetical protein R3C32_04810 [Chloroflexota bacterium]